MLDLAFLLEKIESEKTTRGISESALATEIGIPQTSLNSILRKDRNIGINTLNAIMAARPGWFSNANYCPICGSPTIDDPESPGCRYCETCGQPVRFIPARPD